MLAGCGLSEATQKRAEIHCRNNLKQIGVAVWIEAEDHENTIPGDFLFLTNHTISPSILICPIDPTRKGSKVPEPPQLLAPGQLQDASISYQLVTPRAKIASSKSEALVRCPFHRQVSYPDGSQVKAKKESK